MIIDSFDKRSAPLIGPGDFYGPQKHLCDVCILTFSHVILSEMQRRFDLRVGAVMGGVDGSKPIYLFEFGGKTVGLCLSGIGATLAGTNVIEINWLVGATKFILFGSAGSLNQAATGGKFVLPTEAYRDEGMSYHYAPPADYIRIRNADRMEALFRALSLPYVKGRVWTTDAFYRETKDLVRARQAEGCLAVEMELAGVQAVCDFHGFALFAFLVTGDVLDAEQYQFAGLPGANHNLDKLDVALELIKRLDEKTYRFYGWQTADVKDKNGLTPRDYYDLLSNIWCAETCAPRMRDRWSKDNPTLGQCSITAFLMQDIFGGEVRGVPLGDGNFHCFNVVDGCLFDLTSEQFAPEVLDYRDRPIQQREIHFAKTEKYERYQSLKARLLAFEDD